MSGEKGVCPDCFKGDILEGEPKGTFEEIGGIKTYIGAGEVQHNDKAILMLTDVFGHALVNNLLIADKLTEATSMRVYVPDLFRGSPMPPEKLNGFMPDEPGGQSKMGFFGKAAMIITAGIPFIVSNRQSIVQPIVEQNLAAIRERGVTKICAIGYCFGGKYSMILSQDKVEAAVHAHPSNWTYAEADNINVPTLLLCPEEDSMMKDADRVYIEEKLKQKNVFIESKVYPGTVHGFAARPSGPKAKAAFTDANEKIAEFAKRFLA